MKKILLIIFLLLNLLLPAQGNSQTLIPLKSNRVEEFLTGYPEYDGRGTIIIIMDTGVDFGIEGLTKTSTGETKVIDVRDFTQQGDISFYEADIEEENGVSFFFNEKQNYKINGAERLTLKAVDEKYYIGNFAEKLLMNSVSKVTDLNGNGKENDNFYYVTFQVSENNNKFWVVYIDIDSDGDLADEKPLRSYKENFDSFSIPNGTELPDLTIAVNIIPDEKKVNFFFDDGGHGTHCAGIASGFNIGGKGINGVAPGSNIIALKIGYNTLASGTVNGSMKNAFLYADKISKEKKEPCIINLSYGIGAEIEGHSEIEKFLNELTSQNPYLYIAKSNGNDGPGISTAGLPCNSKGILSLGAVLTKEVGNNFYGASLNRDLILHFSSRGAEMTKPDVIAPGACVSTVPNYDKNDVSWGTSMASPYAAGVISLLLSAAQKEFPNERIPSQFLYKVIRESADRWNDYFPVDQGSGSINVVKAYELLKKYLKNGELKNFETYTTSSFAPHMPGGKAANLYIRNGNFITGKEDFALTVTRDNFIKKDKFYRLYNIKSGSDWLIPLQTKSHIRNNQPLNINIKLDKSQMTEPGLYNGMIYGTRDDNTNIPEFEMMASVVIPYEFNSSNNFMMKWENEKLSPGMHKRYFLNIPAGVSNIRIKFVAGLKNFCNLRYYLHDVAGREVAFSLFNISYSDEYNEKFIYPIKPGVYELVVMGNYKAKEESTYNLLIDFDGLNRTDENKISIGENSIKAENIFNEIKYYSVSGEVSGYQNEYEIKIENVRNYEIPFFMKKKEYLKKFKVEMSKEDFNKITDFTLIIIDENGIQEEASTFSYFEKEVSVTNSSLDDEKKYILKIVPGLTNENDNVNLKITEQTFIEKPEEIIVKPSSLNLYPTVETRLKFSIEKPGFEKPDDSIYIGKLYFKSKTGTECEIPLLINNGDAK